MQDSPPKTNDHASMASPLIESDIEITISQIKFDEEDIRGLRFRLQRSLLGVDVTSWVTENDEYIYAKLDEYGLIKYDCRIAYIVETPSMKVAVVSNF